MADVLAAPQQTKTDASLRTLFGISAAHWVSHFHMFVLPMLFPFLKAQLGVGYIELGFALTVFAVVSALTQAPLGYLAVATDLRWPIVTAHLLLSIALLAGAVVLAPSDTAGIMSSHLHADGRYRDILAVPGTVANGKIQGTPFLHMDGGAVFKFAVKVLAEVAQEALSANDLPSSAIDWLIPHQANIRIMEATMKKLALPIERMVSTVAEHANTSAASIPLALDIAVRDGRIRAGHHVLLAGVGGGFTWGSVLLHWH